MMHCKCLRPCSVESGQKKVKAQVDIGRQLLAVFQILIKQFQYQLSAKLAKGHPELSKHLCEEIMLRQLDVVDIIAQHQVLTCMAPWIENLNFVMLLDSRWNERLLKSLYYVTSRHGDQFPDEIEKLWSTIASKSKKHYSRS